MVWGLGYGALGVWDVTLHFRMSFGVKVGVQGLGGAGGGGSIMKPTNTLQNGKGNERMTEVKERRWRLRVEG